MALNLTTRRDVEIRRYPILVYVLAPLIALAIQGWLPRLVGAHVWFDLPLLVTVYIALARRDPIQGMSLGAALGIFQDALTHHAIGINGIAKTAAGFLAASVGNRIDLENQTVRMAMNFTLTLLGSVLSIFCYRFLLGMEIEWSWLNELLKAVGDALLTLLLYPLLDRMRIRE
jgi:rod shape-determining protein MreD